MRAARNAPCPCGSGKKYKHCHGGGPQAESSPEETAWRTVRRALDGFPAMMFRFVHNVYGPAAVDGAWDEFTLGESEDEVRFDPESPHVEVFLPWFFHQWSPDPDDTWVEDDTLFERPPTRVLLERRGSRLDPVLRRYLEGCLASVLSFHEVLRTDPGRGFRSRDVITGEEHEVLDRSASGTLNAGDIFFGQIVTSNGVTMLESCGPYAAPPHEKLGLIDLRERIAGGAPRPSLETIRDWDIELRDAYLDICDRITNPRMPRLVNTEGDEIVFHRLVFEVASAAEAFGALKHLALDESEEDLLESAEHDAEGALRRVIITWKMAGNPQHADWENTVLGHLTIDGDRLTAELNSAERARKLRGIVEESLGDHARFLEAEVESVEDAVSRRHATEEESEPSDAISLEDHPEVRERLLEMTRTYYEGWVTQEIPALGGLTPLEAVEDRVGREKVEALIAHMKRPGGRGEPLDESVVRSLRARLGLG